MRAVEMGVEVTKGFLKMDKEVHYTPVLISPI